ncbi:hypothetical protein [Spiroplasma sp. AdecLV25b]|uniref:hypothetical protein n=1 Tax=Spiroplasma sp. AdecLV25b TaxID=3027162 RepID=UPI0027DF8286|nr:hypothetical protein [Spiroplasma sp. AdecLV25b]
MFKKEKVMCRAPDCFNISNNSLEKWQLDLCTIHLIEFMRWIKKDEKIRDVFYRFCEKWELIKNSNNVEEKKKIKQKINELQVYFQNQEKLGIEFEKQSLLKKETISKQKFKRRKE